MKISVSKSRSVSGFLAASRGAQLICQAIENRDQARIILATGASQFDMLDALVTQPGIDWSKCTVFHLDEYIGLGSDHPASFANYLDKRFVKRVPDLLTFESINGVARDINAEIARLNAELEAAQIDVAFIGIGENGHLAFNDPPADFETEAPFIRVSLDQACRKQQVYEGWFDTMEDVPSEAITMSIAQILRSRSIICTVPDERKANAVHQAVVGPVSNNCPASALRKHENTWLYLDEASANKLSESTASESRVNV